MSTAIVLYAHMSDNELIERIKAGENACFEVLMRRHSSSLYRIGRMHNFSHLEVENILHDIFAAIFRQTQHFNTRQSYRLWLISKMLSVCLRKYEISNKRNPEDIYFEPASRATDIPVNDRNAVGLTNMLEKGVESLPLVLRHCFVLSEIEGLAVKEVCTLLDFSETIVKNHISLAKATVEKFINSIFSYTQIYPFHKSCCDALIDKVLGQIDAKAYHIEKALMPRV